MLSCHGPTTATLRYTLDHLGLLFVLFAYNKEEAICSGDYHYVYITRTQKANFQRIRLKWGRMRVRFHDSMSGQNITNALDESGIINVSRKAQKLKLSKM